MNAHEHAYRAAIAADEAYSAELTRVYGRKACDARYDERGTATGTLASLSAAKLEADAAWLAMMAR